MQQNHKVCNTLLLGKSVIQDKTCKNESQLKLFYGHTGALEIERLSVYFFFFQIG